VGETFTLGDLRLVDDVSSADWIVARVRNFEHDVGSLLPVGFAAYARVCHPAMRRLDGDAWAEVSWSQVAAANGRVTHASMEWIAITGEWRYLDHDAQLGIWDRAPRIGSLPLRQAHTLADVLRQFTEKPSECWFAVWDGSGCSGLPAPGHNAAHAPAADGTVRWTFERGHHLLRRTVPRHGPSLVARGPKLVRCH
jgi:hypothetical protein